MSLKPQITFFDDCTGSRRIKTLLNGYEREHEYERSNCTSRSGNGRKNNKIKVTFKIF